MIEKVCIFRVFISGFYTLPVKMEKWVPEKCACCGEKFEKRSKGYDRTEIRSRCRGNAASVVDALYSLYDVTLTPNKNTFACNRCSCLISTLAAKRAQLEETETRLQNVKLAGGYISCNIPATTLLKTPQQTKSERVSYPPPQKKTKNKKNKRGKKK